MREGWRPEGHDYLRLWRHEKTQFAVFWRPGHPEAYAGPLPPHWFITHPQLGGESYGLGPASEAPEDEEVIRMIKNGEDRFQELAARLI